MLVTTSPIHGLLGAPCSWPLRPADDHGEFTRLRPRLAGAPERLRELTPHETEVLRLVAEACRTARSPSGSC
jgi:hypothetical protein